MKLTRPARPPGLISLVPMVDVLLILLVFFMVTSTYLNLDMIPARSPQASLPAQGASPASANTVIIRLGANGQPAIRGRPLGMGALQGALSSQLASSPQTQVLILPTGATRTQALVSVLDAAATAGVKNLRVLRLEAHQ